MYRIKNSIPDTPKMVVIMKNILLIFAFVQMFSSFFLVADNFLTNIVVENFTDRKISMKYPLWDFNSGEPIPSEEELLKENGYRVILDRQSRIIITDESPGPQKNFTLVLENLNLNAPRGQELEVVQTITSHGRHIFTSQQLRGVRFISIKE